MTGVCDSVGDEFLAIAQRSCWGCETSEVMADNSEIKFQCRRSADARFTRQAAGGRRHVSQRQRSY